MTPWWLRPTAEGAKEEKDRPQEKATQSSPSPQTPASVAPESVPLAPESLRETSPSLEAEPAWRHEPVPEPEPSWHSQPIPTDFVEEPEESGELHLGQPELVPEEPEPADDDEEDDEEELSAQSETADGADSADSVAQEEARGEAKRRRPRRSRGRGRKESGKEPRSAAPADEDEEESPEPAYEEAPSPRRVAVNPPMAPLAQMPAAGGMTQIRSARTESFTIPASDFESVAREIVISVPERQRVADERKIAMFIDFENIAIGVTDAQVQASSTSRWSSSGWSRRARSSSRRPTPTGTATTTTRARFHEAAIELIEIPPEVPDRQELAPTSAWSSTRWTWPGASTTSTPS